MDYFKHIYLSEISMNIVKQRKLITVAEIHKCLCFFICLVICIDLLVAGKVGEFATFAKFTIFAKFAIFVNFAIFAACKGGSLVLLFALSRWLLEKL